MPRHTYSAVFLFLLFSFFVFVTSAPSAFHHKHDFRSLHKRRLSNVARPLVKRLNDTTTATATSKVKSATATTSKGKSHTSTARIAGLSVIPIPVINANKVVGTKTSLPKKAAATIAATVSNISAVSNAASTGNNDQAVFQFALSLEYVDISLFNSGATNFTDQDFVNAGYPAGTRTQIQRIAADEQSHANYLSAALTASGVTPRQPCQYTFPYTDVKSFMALAATVEGVRTSAYLGGITGMRSRKNIAGAGSILVDETRHNTVLRSLDALDPMANPFGTPLSSRSVASLAAEFFASCPAGSDLGIETFPSLTITSDANTIGSAVTLTTTADLTQQANVFCGFASGTTVIFSTFDTIALTCDIPDGLGGGQTYLALSSSDADLSDANILAGIGVINVVTN